MHLCIPKDALNKNEQVSDCPPGASFSSTEEECKAVLVRDRALCSCNAEGLTGARRVGSKRSGTLNHLSLFSTLPYTGFNRIAHLSSFSMGGLFKLLSHLPSTAKLGNFWSCAKVWVGRGTPGHSCEW